MYRGTANSFATLGYSIFGYLPAPALYGFVSSWTSDEKIKKMNLHSKIKKPLSRIPMAVIVYSVFIIAILYTIVT